MAEPTPDAIDAFIQRWEKSGGHERGAGHQFLIEFCELLGLGKPDPPVADNALNAYTFERRVDRRKPDGTTTPNWIDLYKSGSFVMETKQGVNRLRDKENPDQPLLPALETKELLSLGHGTRGGSAFDKALERAHAQGERYIQALPTEESRPPFLIVCDVGHSFDLYAEFSGTGGQYERFPDPRSHRILLKDLHKQETRDLFRKIWSDPHSLDPTKYAAEVTREVAKALADLAKSLEKDGHDPQITAGFLQRCLFTMFAEDVELLPKNSFLNLLHIAKENPAGFPVLLTGLWKDMDQGTTFSAAIHAAVIQFNGGLFKDCTVLPLRPDQILYLIHAAKQDWSRVEPAIFGTLLERALDPRERHKLGAHYTPRSYVERLVRPTLIEPLREKWEAVRAAAAQLDEKGKIKDARATVEAFHKEIAAIRVLDPACGSGNFLYVSLELLKRLEAEVLDLFEKLGGDRALEMNSVIVRPDNFLGIELNPRAAAIAQIVLWIGYFQFHRRATGKADTNDRPLLPKHNTIECRDAVLAYDEKIPRKDEHGNFVNIWDGRTTKPHPVTGKEVPDESARTNLFDYTNPKRAEWPRADYIVGNPPFIGVRKMISALGEGYVEALRKAHPDVPETTDLVGFWWDHAALLVKAKKLHRFGLITTNSITQEYSRKILERHLDGKGAVSLVYAVADHPWVDTADGAAVRVAMHVVSPGERPGVLAVIESEAQDPADPGTSVVQLREYIGRISSKLKLSDIGGAPLKLKANENICFQGVVPAGEGFKLESNSDNLTNLRLKDEKSPIRDYLIGKDLVQTWSPKKIIDCYGLTDLELKEKFPEIYQHLLVNVKPQRDQNRRDSYREKWWLFAEPRPAMRKAISGLTRFIGTPYTAKYRPFVFINKATIPDAMVYAIASDDAYHLGCLSSEIHLAWAKSNGGTLEDRPRYNSNGTFLPFPFPSLKEGELKQRIRELGERLDAHRKARQTAHPDLTLTGMYNVLEKLRAGEALSDKERKIHDEGLVTVLKQIHDDLDAAVLEAYGWEDLNLQKRMLEAQRDMSNPILVTLRDDGTQETRELGADEIRKNLREQEEAWEQELLTRLVALNHERAEEERNGHIRWLRPEYQRGGDHRSPQPEQKQIDLGPPQIQNSEFKIENSKSLSWPGNLDAQFAEIRKLLPATGPDAPAIAAFFGKKTKARITQIEDILKTLKSLGMLE
jgi:hypothetical protein